MGNFQGGVRFNWKPDLPDIRDKYIIFEQNNINTYVTNITLKNKLWH